MTPAGPPDGFLIPVRQALIQPVLLAGVPRSFAMVNFTIAAALGLGRTSCSSPCRWRPACT